METTFLMIKPDAVGRGTVGEIVSILERSGFEIADVASRTLSREAATRFYDVHLGKPFFEGLIDFIVSGMTLGLVLKADDAVAKLRRLVGTTDPSEAEPGTIRAMYGTSIRENAVHAADAPKRVEYEMAVYFAGHAKPDPE